jgi:hypothetical protein
MHLHVYVLTVLSYAVSESNLECFMLIGAGFGNRSPADLDDPSCEEEEEVCHWCATPPGRGHVACATESEIKLHYMPWLKTRPRRARKGITMLSRALNQIVG